MPSNKLLASCCPAIKASLTQLELGWVECLIEGVTRGRCAPLCFGGKMKYIRTGKNKWLKADESKISKDWVIPNEFCWSELTMLLKKNGMENLDREYLLNLLRSKGYLYNDYSPKIISKTLGFFKIEYKQKRTKEGKLSYIRNNKTGRRIKDVYKVVSITKRGVVNFISLFCNKEEENIIWLTKNEILYCRALEEQKK